MQQLLSIKTTPIQIDYQVTNAQLNYKTKNPVVEISRQKGGFEMHSEPIKVKIDNFEVRQSIGLKSNGTLVQEYSDKGKSDVYEAISQILDEGNQIVNPHGMTIPQMASQKASKTIETVLDFLPSARPEMTWEGGTLDVNFTPDTINMDFDSTDRINFEYTPAQVQFSIKQYPSVNIEYLGGPMYVPPSAAEYFTGQNIDIKV